MFQTLWNSEKEKFGMDSRKFRQIAAFHLENLEEVESLGEKYRNLPESIQKKVNKQPNSAMFRILVF